MESLRFDEGYKSFCINDDESRVISFNPADYGLLERFSCARKKILEAVTELEKDINIDPEGEASDELEGAAELIRNVRELINGQIDYIFNAECSLAAFGNQSPISTVKGKFLFERFLEAIMPEVEKEIKAEQRASQKRIDKYAKQVIR
jgi:hypothetical protein